MNGELEMMNSGIVRRVVVLQHGEAHPSANGSHHAWRNRKLTDRGMDQGLACREVLGSLSFDRIYVCPTKAAQETAGLVAGDVESLEVVEVLHYQDPDRYSSAAKVADLLEKLGNVAYEKYLDAAEPAAIETFGDDAWFDINSSMQDRDEKCALIIGGHGVLIAAIGHAACVGNIEGQEEIAKETYGECEGFILELDGHDFVMNIVQLKQDVSCAVT